MDLNKPADAVIAIDNAHPGYTSDVYSIHVQMNDAVTTIDPDHMEIDIDTYNFIDSPVESGGVNTADDFKKQIEVKTLTWYDDTVYIDHNLYYGRNYRPIAKHVSRQRRNRCGSHSSF